MSETNVQNKYKRLCALRDAATPGIWEIRTSGGRNGGSGNFKQIADLTISSQMDPDRKKGPFEVDQVRICAMSSSSYERQSLDAAFIAAAHDAMRLLDQVMAERERDRKDAERYRWMKHNATRHWTGSLGQQETWRFTGYPFNLIRGPELDAAIDAAILAKTDQP